MKYLCLMLSFFVLTGEQCKDKKKQAGPPDEDVTVTEISKDILPCIEKKIEEGEKDSPRSSPLKVDEYTYKGKRVFLFTAPCCDNFNELYDDSCHVICAPSGGFTGRGDGKCTDFKTEAVFVKQVWARKEESNK